MTSNQRPFDYISETFRSIQLTNDDSAMTRYHLLKLADMYNNLGIAGTALSASKIKDMSNNEIAEYLIMFIDPNEVLKSLKLQDNISNDQKAENVLTLARIMNLQFDANIALRIDPIDPYSDYRGIKDIYDDIIAVLKIQERERLKRFSLMSLSMRETLDDFIDNAKYLNKKRDKLTSDFLKYKDKDPNELLTTNFNNNNVTIDEYKNALIKNKLHQEYIKRKDDFDKYSSLDTTKQTDLGTTLKRVARLLKTLDDKFDSNDNEDIIKKMQNTISPTSQQ